MRPALHKLAVLAVPACAIAALVSLMVVEAWVRWRWDDRRGTPGFYVSDPVRGQRLRPGYDGWFAGVPVRINTLGFRDTREYAIEKAPGTFRILVLGDSVTFGHGTLNETTYPFLLEQRLKQWRPGVKWEVWNLGVPGYNTSQELAYLNEIGPRYAPDLVIAGFYPNDFTANAPASEPSLVRRAASGMQRVMQRNLYSFELYKRAILTARWKLFTSDADRMRIEALAGEESLLVHQDLSQSDDQRLTGVEYFDDDEVSGFTCPGEPPADPLGARQRRDSIRDRGPEIAPWLDAVEALQRLGRDGVYRLMFFINMAPKTCASADRFYDAGELADDDVLIEVLGQGVPVASSTRAFLHYRPSQMPAAAGHSIGNSNRVKADVLFDFLRDNVLPPLLASPSTGTH